MSQNKEQLWASDKERNDYIADSAFQDQYYKDDEIFDESIPLCVPKSKEIKSEAHIYGIDLKMDHIVDELIRIKKQREKYVR
jgi:hypothetical protein